MDLTAILFMVLAVVNGLPVISALVPSQLTRLYGIAPDDEVLIALLQHRAVLLGLVGAACICAAILEPVRWPVLIGTLISMVGFILICALRGQLKGPLKKIAVIDALALPVALGLVVIMVKF